MDYRFDSWKNLLAGIGNRRDKGSYTHFYADFKLSYEYLEELYMNDDIACRICELVPQEMLRQDFLITVNDEELHWSDLKDYLLDALIKSRVYGCAFIYIGADDGLLQEEPLDLNQTNGIEFLHVLTPKDIRLEKDKYYLNNQTAIHESRLIKFFASRTLNDKWPSSILQRIYPVLQHFNTAWQATAHLMTDAAQGVFKLKGLHSALASNRSEDLLKRMELVDMSRSVSRSILLDAEDEDFRRDSYSFGGIPEILDKVMLRLAAASRLPVSLLMGQSPAGLNATGESDIRFFYDQVKAEQGLLKPKIEQLVKIYLGVESAKINITFPALWQMTDKEKAELRRMEAETDRIYLDAGVLLPEEVALKRFPENHFNKERIELLEDE